jgi:hypothetical protein
MEHTLKTPSLFRIITIDYGSFLAVASPIVVWILLAALSIFGVLPDLRWGRDPIGREGIPLFLSMATVVTALALPLFSWRVGIIWSTLLRGTEVPGQIVSVFFFRDRGRVEYTYEFQGQAFRRGNGIMKTRQTEILETNSRIVLAVDPEYPKRAFIRDLYIR